MFAFKFLRDPNTIGLLKKEWCNIAGCFPSTCVRFGTWSNRRFLRRAVMYVPAADDRKVKKIPTLGVDVVVLDFEDGVAVNQKESARSKVLDGLKIASQCKSERVVRINGIDSDMLSADLRAIFLKRNCYDNAAADALMLPKCESREHLKQLDFATGFFLQDTYTEQKPLPLHIIIESPRALNFLTDICEYGLQKLRHLKLEVVVFGSDDFLAALGGHRTETAAEVLYARQSLVTTAKAFGLQAIDVVSIDFKNLEGLRQQSLEAARMGFTGKQIIHPGQISVVQDAFSPSEKQLAWAKGLIEAFHKHQQSGRGAFTYQDKMIDKPLLLQAENIIKMNQTE